MTTRQQRNQRKRDAKNRAKEPGRDPTPESLPRPTSFQRNRLIVVLVLLAVWFLFLLYVAFGR